MTASVASISAGVRCPSRSPASSRCSNRQPSCRCCRRNSIIRGCRTSEANFRSGQRHREGPVELLGLEVDVGAGDPADEAVEEVLRVDAQRRHARPPSTARATEKRCTWSWSASRRWSASCTRSRTRPGRARRGCRRATLYARRPNPDAERRPGEPVDQQRLLLLVAPPAGRREGLQLLAPLLGGQVAERRPPRRRTPGTRRRTAPPRRPRPKPYAVTVRDEGATGRVPAPAVSEPDARRATGRGTPRRASRLNARGPSLASSEAKTAAPDPGVVGPAVVLVLALGVAHRLEDGLDGERAVGGDQVGDLVRLGQRLAVGHDVADQAELLGLGGQDRAGR